MSPVLGPVAQQTLILVRSMPAGEPYIARGCRRKQAQQLAQRDPPLLDVETISRAPAEDWLACRLTEAGRIELDAIFERLRKPKA